MLGLRVAAPPLEVTVMGFKSIDEILRERNHKPGPDPGNSALSDGPVCEEEPYPRYEPGVYEVECVGAKTYWHPLLRCWKCRLEFKFLGTGSSVFYFLHLGSGERPHAGRNSEYMRVWIVAHGDKPRKRQTLTDRVFVKKLFEVQVEDTQRRYDGSEHAPAGKYSVVRRILRRTYP